jgi:uncharacterized FlaG/YvyC family protein
MATISKIAGVTETQVTGSQLKIERASRADAGHQQQARVAEAPRPKGVQEVLKAQKDNELQTGSFSEKDLREMARSLQETIARATKEQYEVGFRQDDGTGTQIIEIKDKEGNLVKQFPPEKVLNLQRKMDELSGMVIDEMI